MKQLGLEVKVSSVQTWKRKYMDKIRHKHQAGEVNNLSMKSLPVKKRGRPLLLGEKLDSEVKCYIQAVRGGGEVMTTAITTVAATAIVKKSDRNLLAKNRGSITITSNWAKSLLSRMNFVKRKGSSTAKMTVTNFEAVNS